MSDFISALSTRVATIAADYDKAKEDARKAKHDALVALTDDYFAEAEDGNVQELAEVLGKSVAFATALAKETGNAGPAGKRGRPSKFSDDEQKDIAEKFASANDTFEQMALAVEHRVAPETIKGWAVKLGLIEVKKRVKQDA